MAKHAVVTLAEVIVVLALLVLSAFIVVPWLNRAEKEAGEFKAVESFNLSGQGVEFSLGEGDTTVFIENSNPKTFYVRKVVLTDCGEKIEWIVNKRRCRDNHYRRGVDAYHVYAFSSRGASALIQCARP